MTRARKSIQIAVSIALLTGLGTPAALGSEAGLDGPVWAANPP